MILVFDTSGKDLHIGLFDAKQTCVGEFHHIASDDERGVHDSLLAEKTLHLLHEHHASALDLQKIGFINGPGSFTGLRIGLAFAKGLAFGGSAVLVPLIAHTVLREIAIRSYPEVSFDGIVMPGYEPKSVYYASFDAPANVTLRPVDEIAASGVRSLAAMPPLDHRFEESEIAIRDVYLDLAVMAVMVAYTADGAPVSALEPFYGTDFKPQQERVDLSHLKVKQ